MPLVIAQTFPLGRYHATKWNESPFEDCLGEWPPSPWRLLRALAARWFQYQRETNDSDTGTRDKLLQLLASSPPTFHLPQASWRGRDIRQYLPTALELQYKYSNEEDPATGKKRLEYSYRQVTTTLSLDAYRVVPASERLLWMWPKLTLSPATRSLLVQLLRRTHYFGRAEAWTRMRIVDPVESAEAGNCTLRALPSSTSVPVLVASPGTTLDMKVLLASTDDIILSHVRIPPGTVWYYAEIPPLRRMPRPPKRRLVLADEPGIIQFAVGGDVLPPPQKWVRITSRFRGSAVRHLITSISTGRTSRYEELSNEERGRIALFIGKNAEGRPLTGHQHPYFALIPDQNGEPRRLICSRQQAFTAQERDAVLTAAKRDIRWADAWSVRLVPLPPDTSVPPSFQMQSRLWISATPYIPPRHYLRRHGCQRASESVAGQIQREIAAAGIGRLDTVDFLTQCDQWVELHETLVQRRVRQNRGERRVRRGWWIRLVFTVPTRGPICLGHSSHFGMGLFVPVLEK